MEQDVAGLEVTVSKFEGMKLLQSIEDISECSLVDRARETIIFDRKRSLSFSTVVVESTSGLGSKTFRATITPPFFFGLTSSTRPKLPRAISSIDAVMTGNFDIL